MGPAAWVPAERLRRASAMLPDHIPAALTAPVMAAARSSSRRLTLPRSIVLLLFIFWLRVLAVAGEVKRCFLPHHHCHSDAFQPDRLVYVIDEHILGGPGLPVGGSGPVHPRQSSL